MSDIMATAVINWLQATADDAMGMEPGDRHMANEARKEIERLRHRIAKLEKVLEEVRQAAEDDNLFKDYILTICNIAALKEQDDE